MAMHHASPEEVFDLAPLSPKLKDARTTAVVKSEAFEVVRLIVHAGTDIKAHQVDGPITLHCLEGRLCSACLKRHLNFRQVNGCISKGAFRTRSGESRIRRYCSRFFVFSGKFRPSQ